MATTQFQTFTGKKDDHQKHNRLKLRTINDNQ